MWADFYERISLELSDDVKKENKKHLDKLEKIDNFFDNLTIEEFENIAIKCGANEKVDPIEFVSEDGHLDLDNTCDEICMLYKLYGLELDENLTKDAIELKNKILKVVEVIRKL